MQDSLNDILTNHRPSALKAAIPRAAVAAVDSLHRKIILSGTRVVALAAPHHDDAPPEISLMLCQSFAASGTNTLFVDASAEMSNADAPDA